MQGISINQTLHFRSGFTLEDREDNTGRRSMYIGNADKRLAEIACDILRDAFSLRGTSLSMASVQPAKIGHWVLIGGLTDRQAQTTIELIRNLGDFHAAGRN